MGIQNLERLFKPKSIAVVGASDTPGSIGAAVIREAGRCGTGAAVVISAGGKEAGTEGRRIEAEIGRAAAEGGVRIVGPNCLGVICSESRLNASFAGRMPLPGKMAFISQSGAICTAVLDLSIREKMGFSYFISLGSMLDVDFGDAIDYVGSDPNVSSVVMYVENLTRIRNFMSAARAVSRVKPIVVLKSGRSRAGARAAASHTGALAGEDAIYDAAFHRAGVTRVFTFEELFDCAELLAKQSPPTGSGLVIVTNAGGPGVMAADKLGEYGVDPAPLSDATRKTLDAFLPAHWSRANPCEKFKRSPAWRLRIPVEHLRKWPPDLKAEQMRYWLQYKKKTKTVRGRC